MEVMSRVALIVLVLLLIGLTCLADSPTPKTDSRRLVHWVISGIDRSKSPAEIQGMGSDGTTSKAACCKMDELKYQFGMLDDAEWMIGRSFDAYDFASGIKAIENERQYYGAEDIVANIIVVALRTWQATEKNWIQSGKYGLSDLYVTPDNHLKPSLLARITTRYSRSTGEQAIIKEASETDKFGPMPADCRYAKLVLIQFSLVGGDICQKRTPFLLRADNSPTVQLDFSNSAGNSASAIDSSSTKSNPATGLTTTTDKSR